MLNRRDLLATAGACVAATLLPRTAAARFDPQPGAWRGFTVTTRLDIAAAGEPVQAWIPLPSVEAEDWIVQDGDTWDGNAATAEVKTDPRYGARLLHASFAPGEAAPSIEVVSRFRIRDRAVFDAPQQVAALSDAERTLWLAPTELMPVDGIVKETADRITAGVTGDREQARAIYEWVVENTERTAATRGCGLGDVASMLETGFLGGKCADLNALYVGLARSVGVPSRDVYGVRVADSAEFKSLGKSGEITKAQHCRAESYLTGFGWVPVDPADVRKVVLEERGGLPLTDPAVLKARAKLFGQWEMNWLAYNYAHDIKLPGSTGDALGFFMYPQAEVSGERRDSLDPDSFRYKLTARELGA